MNLRPFSTRTRAAGTLLLVLAAMAVTGLGPLEAQVTSPEARLRMYQAHRDMVETSPFGNLPWQFLGPTNVSGRMTDVAVVAPKGENYTIYVAGAVGGVWRTLNEGVSWEPIFQEAPSTSIGDVTVAPSSQNTVWVGTGEANIFRSSMAGVGVYKSTDGGESWRHMGLAGTHTIPRIVVHPTNPNVVYVAAAGHEWTHDPERGLYKSIDGGENWEKILYIDEETGVIDLVMHPTDPNTLYAATWQRIREKWNDPRNEPHYDGSAIYKTTDGGATWTEVTNGLPSPEHRGRIGIDIARSNPDMVYAFVDNYEVAREAPEGETDAYGRPRGPVIQGASVFRSENGGGSWTRMSDSDAYMQGLSGTYGWVFGQMRVDPNDEDKIYVMGLGLNVSEDGGRSFRGLGGMHGDHHGLWIDPANSDYLVNVNDGGVAISYDGGENWRTFYDNLPLVQFFNVAHDMGDPFRVYGSVQDQGSYRGIVDLSRGRSNIPAVDFEGAPGGEGSSHAIDPTDPDVVYSAGFYGTISRTQMSTGESTLLVPRPEPGEANFRGQWVAPFIISPHNPRIIYHGMNFLFRSMDRGDSWERISPDLSFNDPAKYGDIPYQTIFSIAESPFKFGLLYAGTDDGRIWRTDNGGTEWHEINRGVPVKWVAELVASKYEEGTVYMAQNGKRDDDFLPYLWKSTDFGEHWTSIVNNLPSGPVNVIKEDPRNPDVLYVGTDLGVYVSLDGGEAWSSLPGGPLPASAFFQDLVIHPQEDILVAAAHGRGLWALDVRPIQALTPELRGRPLHLFDLAQAQLPRGWRDPGSPAVIQYWIGSPQGSVNITVRNAQGEVVRELTGEGGLGFHTMEWDLQGPPATQGGRVRGTRIPAGSYTVVVSSGGAAQEGTLYVIE